jgi:DNA-binding NtrC family response regulator
MVFKGGMDVAMLSSTADNPTLLRMRADDSGITTLPNVTAFGRFVGASASVRRLYPLCQRLAQSRIPVIIEGETGTGKEVLAESIHEAGSGGPFIVFDCTAVSSTLIESELFGHERGAFTGAVGSQPGVFEEADGGTLLIDEIGDLDLSLQSKLLRVIDRGEVRRVGGRKWIRVDVRVLAATRRDLEAAAATGRFRDDLFHRLAIGRIELPPLRERHGDVPLLTRRFASEIGAPPEVLSGGVMQLFSEYSWPGNVRQLRNAVARLVALGDVALTAHKEDGCSGSSESEWGDCLRGILANNPVFAVARRKMLDEFERRYVEHALDEHGGNVAEAARASGLAARYFRLLKARRGE